MAFMEHPMFQRAYEAYVETQRQAKGKTVVGADVTPLPNARRSLLGGESTFMVGESSGGHPNDGDMCLENSPVLMSPAAMTSRSAGDVGILDGPGCTVILSQQARPPPTHAPRPANHGVMPDRQPMLGGVERFSPQGRVPFSQQMMSPSSISSPVVSATTGGVEGSPHHRRNLMRRQRNEFMRNQRGPNAAAALPRIPTDANGNVTSLKSILNRAIRDTAGRVSDVSLKEFNQHPPSAFQLIEHDIHASFSVDPPLRQDYIKSYLQEALSWTRYQWKKYWIKNKTRHPNCPIKRYPALVAQWTSEPVIEESERMTRARGCRRPVDLMRDSGVTSNSEGSNVGSGYNPEAAMVRLVFAPA